MSNVRLIMKNIVKPTHNCGHGYSNSFTLIRDVPLYPQDTVPQHVTMRLTVRHSWIIISPSKPEAMDSPATPTEFSPVHSLAPRNESCYTKGKAVAHASLWLAR